MGTLKQLDMGLRLVRELAQSEVVKHARKRAREIVGEQAQKIAHSDRLPSVVCGAAGLLSVVIASDDKKSDCCCSGAQAAEATAGASEPTKAEAPSEPRVEEEPVSLRDASVFEDPSLKEKMDALDASAGGEPMVDDDGAQQASTSSEQQEEGSASAFSSSEAATAQCATTSEGEVVKPSERVQTRRSVSSSPKARNAQNKSSKVAKKNVDKSSKKK